MGPGFPRPAAGDGGVALNIHILAVDRRAPSTTQVHCIKIVLIETAKERPVNLSSKVQERERCSTSLLRKTIMEREH